MLNPQIRKARPGDEKEIHESHMRSIREICVKDHGTDQVQGWGNRSLGDRWTQAIEDGDVWVIEFNGKIHGHGFIKIYEETGGRKAHIHGLYLTPELLGKGLGLKLATLMLQKARNSGAKTVTLESTITAHEFYKKLGFTDIRPMEHVKVGGSIVSCFPMALQISD